MTWQLPFVTRGRFDDARAQVRALEEKVTKLEAQRDHLVDQIFERHGVRPVFAEPKRSTQAPAANEEPVDPLSKPALSITGEAIQQGARSARAVTRDVSRILEHRHKVNTGQVREPRPRVVPIATSDPEQQAVADELAEILLNHEPIAANGNGRH